MNAIAESASQFLTFRLGLENYAIGIAPIREILESPRLTSIPLTPAYLRGVMNVRGNVVPVIDLSLRFGMAHTEIARRTCVVIVEVSGQESSTLRIGLLVDAVNEVLDVAAADIGEPPAFGLGIRADFVKGMIHREKNFIVVLDPEHIVSEVELEEFVGASSAEHEAA